MFIVSKGNPLVVDALREFEDKCGFRIEEVLPDRMWNVIMPEAPQVSITADGVRALALMSDNPDAQKIAEEALAVRDGKP